MVKYSIVWVVVNQQISVVVIYIIILVVFMNSNITSFGNGSLQQEE